MASISPMMQQYLDIKAEYKDCILFFRLGDFYEMFFDDAKLASKELELTLTGKSYGQEERAPMCGVPFHSADTYIARLVERGYKVAICEQTEDPQSAKGLVRREVVRIVTPGTVLGTAMLSERENSYIASLYADNEGLGLSYSDISTGELGCTEMPFDFNALVNELSKINPKELLINEGALEFIDLDELKKLIDAFIDRENEAFFSLEASAEAVKRQYAVASLSGLGLEGMDRAVRSLGALLSYLRITQKSKLDYLSLPRVYDGSSGMALDKASIRNLELLETIFEKKTEGSLLGVLDKTLTAMGSRLMKAWLKRPLNSSAWINERLEAVSVLFDEFLLRNNLRDALKAVYDLERLSARISFGNANAKDIIALRSSLAVLPDIKRDIAGSPSSLLSELSASIGEFDDICELIDSALTEEPPFSLREGGLIREGYSSELDELKASIKDAQDWIAALEPSERERTGIKNLKVGFNRVFGYYIDVTRSSLDKVPGNYIRKQTLTGSERFITAELKEAEGLVLNAEAKINQLEYELFQGLRERIKERVTLLQESSAALAGLDVLLSFAEVSDRNNYVRPLINDGDKIVIEKGRHPVIELAASGSFVPNDAYIDRSSSSLLLITGPNMAGKSTYMRQIAIIVLMAQIGCFVPCSRAEIGVCDRIFTRIGASDNLSQGQSTFFVEMSELAYILNSLSERSLVLLDEIGRGTSTYDGLSIAFALCEYIEKRRVRTLFATHYHELTSLEDSLQGLKNLNVDVSEEDGNVVFLHKIVPGSASKSYGIHVAKIAGVPKELLGRAAEKLDELEEKEGDKAEDEQLSFIRFVL